MLAQYCSLEQINSIQITHGVLLTGCLSPSIQNSSTFMALLFLKRLGPVFCTVSLNLGLSDICSILNLSSMSLAGKTQKWYCICFRCVFSVGTWCQFIPLLVKLTLVWLQVFPLCCLVQWPYLPRHLFGSTSKPQITTLLRPEPAVHL